jgi:hypothetical protein
MTVTVITHADAHYWVPTRNPQCLNQDKPWEWSNFHQCWARKFEIIVPTEPDKTTDLFVCESPLFVLQKATKILCSEFTFNQCANFLLLTRKVCYHKVQKTATCRTRLAAQSKQHSH